MVRFLVAVVLQALHCHLLALSEGMAAQSILCLGMCLVRARIPVAYKRDNAILLTLIVHSIFRPR